MPTYDFSCTHCGQTFERIVSYEKCASVRCDCGGATERIWMSRAPIMIPDSIPGGILLENLTPQPKRYYSRTEIKDQMRALNVEQRVRHVGTPGSDKSKHTSRWI